MPRGGPISNSDRVSVPCPYCGEAYNLRADTVDWTCKNNTCRKRFPVAEARNAASTTVIPPVEDDEYQEIPRSAIVGGPKDKDANDEGLSHDEPTEQPYIAAPLEDPPSTPYGSSPPAVEPPLVARPLDDDPPPLQTKSLEDEIPEIPTDAMVGNSPDSAAPRNREDFPETAAWSSSEIQDGRRHVSSASPAPSAAPDSGSGSGRWKGIPASQATRPTDHADTSREPTDRDATKANKRPLTEQEKRKRGPLRLIVASVAIAIVVAGVTWYLRPRPNPEKDWQEAQQAIAEKNWHKARKRLEAFQETHPDDPHNDEVPFFLDFCDAGDFIYSLAHLDPDRGWEELQRIFQKYRDQPVYNLYGSDLFRGIDEVATRYLNRAERDLSLDDIDHAASAFELMRTVGQSLDDAHVEEDLQEIQARLVSAKKQVEFDLAFRDAKENLEIAVNGGPAVNADLIYKMDDEFVRSFPPLADDKELRELRRAAFAAESKRVTYRPELEPSTVEHPVAVRGPVSGAGRSTYVVWGDDSEGDGGAMRGEVFLAMARGVLYAFDPSGQLLWARRMGIDARELPIHVAASQANPRMFIAVSTLDNSLVAIDPSTGRRHWTYMADADQLLTSPPTIVSLSGQDEGTEIRRGLVPAGREIHVIELIQGQRIGRYEIGYPMTSRGVFDPRTQLVYFPADSKRVFALNPSVIDSPKSDDPACPSMLFTHHPSASLRGQPVIVGQYLVTAEASHLEAMKIRAFLLHKRQANHSADAPPNGFVKPDLDAARDISMAGWSWFQPSTTPDRIAVVTDEGELGVFGLNLTNAGEALFPLIRDNEEQTTRLPVSDPFRALAIYSEEHMLWVMVGGRLRLFFLDVINQKIKPVTPRGDGPAKVAGVPVHRAPLDRAGNSFYLTTMSLRGDHYETSAVDVESGELRWQRQLGVNLAIDPVVMNRGVLLIDRSGRMLGLPTSDADGPIDLPTRFQASRRRALPRGASASNLIRQDTPDGGFYLIAPIGQDRKVAVRRHDDDAVSLSDWEIVRLPAKLSGQPSIWGNYLLAPCGDGLMHSVRMRNSAAESDATQGDILPFALRTNQQPNDHTGYRIYPRDEQSIFVVHGRSLRRLRIVEQGTITRWREFGAVFSAEQRLIGKPLKSNGGIIVADQGGTVRWLADTGSGIVSIADWPIPGEITAEPFIREGRVFVVQDRRVLHCLLVDDAEGMTDPAWTTAPLSGQILGQPPASNGMLIATDSQGVISGFKLADGQMEWRQRLNIDVGPAAAAVPIGGRRMLVPLTDGSLITVDLPGSETEKLARAKQ